MTRTALTLTALLTASQAFAFAPNTTDYYHLDALQPIANSDGDIVKVLCGLTRDNDARSYAECLDEGDVFRFTVESGGSRIYYNTSKFDPASLSYKTVRCFLTAGALGSGGASFKRGMDWDCGGKGTVFAISSVASDRMTLSTTDFFLPCGVKMNYTPYEFDAVSDGSSVTATSRHRLVAECGLPGGTTFQVDKRGAHAYYAFTPTKVSDGCSSIGDDATFGEACDLHDRCWYMPWMSQSTCDDMFYDAMVDTCDAKFGSDPIARTLCLDSAWKHYFAVSTFASKDPYHMGDDMDTAKITVLDVTYPVNAVSLVDDVGGT